MVVAEQWAPPIAQYRWPCGECWRDLLQLSDGLLLLSLPVGAANNRLHYTVRFDDIFVSSRLDHELTGHNTPFMATHSCFSKQETSSRVCSGSNGGPFSHFRAVEHHSSGTLLRTLSGGPHTHTHTHTAEIYLQLDRFDSTMWATRWCSGTAAADSGCEDSNFGTCQQTTGRRRKINHFG